MKINDVKPNIETSGQMEEKFFSIEDQGMIFDILRNKMYSNPISAICREISCNARDAHREVGKSDIPIVITLPTSLEPFYKVKDFGPGISPDRMANIFIKYTASTKRGDNVQTGGFGLGAKTPFSYSDTFTIVTNYNGIQYNYACFIDETKVGKLALLFQKKTTDPNGTEIQIPIKSGDFRTFYDSTEYVTRHWDVKPITKGGILNRIEIKKIIEGTNWAVVSSDSYSSRSCKLVIDGIEYPLDMDTLRKYADTKLINSLYGNLYLYFGVGELSLSASREQVYLDKATQQKIKDKLEYVVKEIKQNVDKKINAFPNFWDANVYYKQELNKSFHDLTFLKPLTWNNLLLHDKYLSLDCPVFIFTKGKYIRGRISDPTKITRSSSRNISFDENSILFINDLFIKAPTPRHVKKAFEDNDKLSSVQVVCPADKAAIDALNKSINMDQMDSKVLSSITKASNRNYTPATSRLLVFKFDIDSCCFKQVSYSSIDEDANVNKILGNLSKDTYGNRQVLLKNNKSLTAASIKSIMEKFRDTSLYGIDMTSVSQDRIEEEFGDFSSLDDFIEEKILANKSNNYVEIKFALNYRYQLDERMIRQADLIEKEIEDPKSLYLEKLKLHNKLYTLCSGDLGLLYTYEALNGEIEKKDLEDFKKNNPNYNLEKINEACLKKYPLLGFLNTYNFSQIVTHIVEYINLIDKK